MYSLSSCKDTSEARLSGLQSSWVLGLGRAALDAAGSAAPRFPLQEGSVLVALAPGATLAAETFGAVELEIQLPDGFRCLGATGVPAHTPSGRARWKAAKQYVIHHFGASQRRRLP